MPAPASASRLRYEPADYLDGGIVIRTLCDAPFYQAFPRGVDGVRHATSAETKAGDYKAAPGWSNTASQWATEIIVICVIAA
jgi:hypothetical protein